MLSKINKRQRQEGIKRKLEEQQYLLRNNWIEFNQFRIAYKSIPDDGWDEETKNFSGFINTNIDNLIN